MQERWFSQFVKEDLPSLSGKVVAITGTTSGTVWPSFIYFIFLSKGYFAAVAAIRKDASHVFLLNRKSNRVEDSLKLLEEEKSKAKASSEIIPIDCDLSDFSKGKFNLFSKSDV